MAQQTDRQKALRLLQDDVSGYGTTRDEQEVRHDLLEAVEAMQQAGIVLAGPKMLDPQNVTVELPLTYANMRSYIQRAASYQLADISNSLLMLHLQELQRTQGGRRKHRVKKTRRGHKKSQKHRSLRANRR